MKSLEVAMIVIKQDEKFVLQVRGEDPAIGASGLIGFFGGKLDIIKYGRKETYEEAAYRELGEEVYIDAPVKGQLKELGRIAVVSDFKLETVRIEAVAYELILDENVVVQPLEGGLVYMTRDEVLQNTHRLTPGTRAGFEELIGVK